MDKSELLSYMPRYYDTSNVVDNANNTNAIELTLFKQAISDTLDQFFIDTSTYLLGRWEKDLGMTINSALSDDIRQSNIKAKLRGQGTCTIALIKNVAESFQNGKVDVVEDNANYQFTIKFDDIKGIPPNIDDLKTAIEQIKPAHLGVIYTFNYTTWGDVKAFTWGAVRTVTWGNLKLVTDIATPIYKTWDDAKTMTWDEAEGFTWNNII